MPHLRTDAGVDLELDNHPAGGSRLVITLGMADALGAAPDVDDDFVGALKAALDVAPPLVLGIDLTAAEARMIGAYLNPAPAAPAEGAELRAAKAAPLRGTYDPAKTLPTNWTELATYARHAAGRGLEVAIVVVADVPALHDLDEHTDAGVKGIKVRVDPDLAEVPGYFEVGRNGQRIARYRLGAGGQP